MTKRKDMKFDQGKPRLDLIEPAFIMGLGKVLAFGAAKYKANSWKSEVHDAEDRYYAAAQRHLIQFRGGEPDDQETGLSHLLHAACNIMFLYYFRKKHEYYATYCGPHMGDTVAGAGCSASGQADHA